jgi:hypothetical protein
VFDAHELDAAGIELDDRPADPVTDPPHDRSERMGGRRRNRRTVHPRRHLRGRARGGRRPGRASSARLPGRPSSDVPRPGGSERRVDGKEARERGHDVRTAIEWIRDNERSQIDGRTSGLVKLVADERTGELLGGHIGAEVAGAMIHEVVAAMAGRTPPSALGGAIHV